jgi:hypothetical protein
MLTILETTGVEPVTLAEAALAARVDGADLNDLITGAISAARQQAEQITGRHYRPKVVRASLASWPTERLPVHSPSACAIAYWSGSAWLDLGPAAYVWAAEGSGAVLAPALGTSWPTLGPVAAGPRVRIDLTVGPAAPADVPDSVKLYCKAQVASWVNNGEALISQQLLSNPLFERLLDGERLWA